MSLWAHVWVCVGECGCVHLLVNVLTFTWQFSRWAECGDTSSSGSTAVRGDDAIGCFWAGRGWAFSTHGHRCLGITLWVRTLHRQTHNDPQTNIHYWMCNRKNLYLCRVLVSVFSCLQLYQLLLNSRIYKRCGMFSKKIPKTLMMKPNVQVRSAKLIIFADHKT